MDGCDSPKLAHRNRGIYLRLMYQEHAPPDPLTDVVECFWTIRSASTLTGIVTNRVLPDGCSDIIVDLGEPPAASAGSHPLGRTYVVGTMQRALVVELTGCVDLLGVRFRLGGGTPVLGVPADELAGGRFALDDVVPGFDDIVGRLAEVPARFRTELFARWLGSLRDSRGHTPDARVAHAATIIGSSDGAVSVGELAAAVGVSRRQLERLFVREVGAAPGEACRVARFRGAVQRMAREPRHSLARVAYASGYCDQAHFTREFHRLAGVPPGAYRRDRDVASVQYPDGSHA